MNIQVADRLSQFGGGIFQRLDQKKEELQKRGRTVYNLSVGTPDFLPEPAAVDALLKAASIPENYKYSLGDMPELIAAAAAHYQRRFGVSLSTDEIMSVAGTQEGISHLALALCNPGDMVLVPNPGYPIFKIGPALCGAVPVEYPLTEENGFLPDFRNIPEETAKKARCMILSYPSNPLCTIASKEFYKELISFAKTYEIVIIHDNAYSDLVYDGETGGSFLAYEGAREVGVEFYSLSKSYNLTGARVSFLAGNKEVIRAFQTIRSQYDYGMFYPIQHAAVAALEAPYERVEQQCKAYERRRNVLCDGLTKIGWEVKRSKGSMFVFAKLPCGYDSSEQFVLELMERSGVIVTPGSSFGSLGEGYVRLALVLPEQELEAAVLAVSRSGILQSEEA